MRIAVVTNWVPFVRGGAESLADALVKNLSEHGHDAVLIRLPFRWQPPEKVVEHILACRCVRLDNVDRVIGLKFPAYYVPHPNKVLWLLHQLRQAYDFWGTPLQDLPGTPEGCRIRDVVRESDRRFLPEYRQAYTISHVIGERLKRFNGIDSEVLFHPLPDAAGFRCEAYGDAVFLPGRITAAKRPCLAIEAMKYVRTPVRLIVAGVPETGADLSGIERTIERDRLQDRVQVIPRFISDAEKKEIFAGALACAYVPYDEDSYGYVTLEAYHSRKPVITCTDSGGTTILVRDGVTGSVVPPDARALADAMDRLFNDRRLARRMGEAGYESMLELEITWNKVVEKLTA
jgi:glycosyltransferase involved in cell wall biosynthesis